MIFSFFFKWSSLFIAVLDISVCFFFWYFPFALESLLLLHCSLNPPFSRGCSSELLDTADKLLELRCNIF